MFPVIRCLHNLGVKDSSRQYLSIYCEICAVNGPEIMKMWKINGGVFQR